jgi:hypothetical protein
MIQYPKRSQALIHKKQFFTLNTQETRHNFNLLLKLKQKNVFYTKLNMMTHALNIWNPSQGIDLGFFDSILQPYVCSCFGLGWYIMKTYMIAKRIYRKIRFTIHLDSPCHIVRLGFVFYDWEYFRNHLLEIFLPLDSPTFEFTGYQGLAWRCHFHNNSNVLL